MFSFTSIRKILGWYKTPSGILLFVAIACASISLVLDGLKLLGLVSVGLLLFYFPYRSLRERKQTQGELNRALRSLEEIREREKDLQQKQLLELEGHISSQRTDFSALQNIVSSQKEDVSVLQEDVSVLQGDTSSFSGSRYIPFDRRITEEDIDLLIQNWSGPLELEILPNEIRYIERRIIFLEGLCRGRIATTSTDIAIRILVARSLSRQNEEFHFLEIGTLFGLGAFILHDSCFDKQGGHLTLIDPLDGYYGNTIPDPITGLIVSEKILRENANRLAIPFEEITLLKGLSTDKHILESAQDNYDLLIVDGDHSYEGIKNDFELYAGRVRKGGVVVVDDYETNAWPDVTRYTDEAIRTDERFEFVGAQSRTALFRRIAD